jgi:hypothetical protein
MQSGSLMRDLPLLANGKGADMHGKDRCKPGPNGFNRPKRGKPGFDWGQQGRTGRCKIGR